MPEMYFRQPGYTYSACDPFTKKKKRIKKIKESRHSRYIYQNELDRACFQYEMAYGDFKDLNRGTATDKVLHDKVFNIAKYLKYDVYGCGLVSMVYTCSGTIRYYIVKYTLKDCLLGAVKLTKDADPNKYFYSGYGTGFDCCSLSSVQNSDWGKNAIISGVDMSSSLHANDKNKDISILGKGRTQGLDDASLTAGAECFINFSRSDRNFV